MEMKRRHAAESELGIIRATLAQRIQDQVTAFRNLSDQRAASIVHDNVRLLEQVQQAQAIADQGMIRLVQNQIVTTALSEAATADDVTEVVVNQGVNIVGAVGGAITSLVDDRTQLRIIGAAGYPQTVIETWRLVPINQRTLIWDAIQSGSPLWIKSPAEARQSHPELLNFDPSHKAWAALPLYADNEVFGALGLTFAKEQTFSEMDKTFIISIAQKCAQALKRIWLAAEIRDQREQFHITLSSLGEGVISTDKQGQITFINPIAKTLTGWTAEKAIGTHLDTVVRVVDEATTELLAGCFEKAIAVEPPPSPETNAVLRHLDGHTIPIDIASTQIRSEQGEITGLVFVLRDVTESRRQQASVSALLQRTQDLYETCHQIGLVNQPLDVLRAQCSSLLI